VTLVDLRHPHDAGIGEMTPEAKAPGRISELTLRSFARSPGLKLSDDERSELDSLRTRYPDLPEDPDDPWKRSRDAIDAALKRVGRKGH
jgi:hypothetical protein